MGRPTIALCVPATSPRLNYVVQWLEEALFITVEVGQVSEGSLENLPFITYGAAARPGAILHIPDEGLLWEEDIKQDIVALKSSVVSALEQGLSFAGSPIPTASFDLFSHVFYHLSRYEEYQPYTPDAHGRFPAEKSVLYEAGVLRAPVLDEWLQTLKAALVKDFSLPNPKFSFQPTYDIDAAWAVRHKGLLRSVGGIGAMLMKGKLQSGLQNVNAILHLATDPHDAYNLVREHVATGESPFYFILAALCRTPFDKNIHPAHTAMQRLTRALLREGEIGMHPSYYATSGKAFALEKKTLEAALGGRSITQSRQHFIRFTLPESYRLLIHQGITDDWSMGYGSHLGFRAGTGRSFLWYDLAAEQRTSLRIHPFCFMDSTAHYHERLTVDEAFAVLSTMRQALRACGSALVTIFHNYSQGTDPEWRGWREAYEAFVKETL